MIRTLAIAALAAGPALTPAFAHDATIDGATARASGDAWTISVTITHAETGWDDYADGWQVLAPDGTELGMRVLAHPHENEQPFTRSLSGVEIPDDLDHVLIRARTLGDGWGDALYRLDLPK